MELEIITSILIIIGIDIVLGGDNAIVIALACRNLPEHQRNKAILAGTFLAIITRIILTLGTVLLLSIPFVKFIGGILLLYIAFQLLQDHRDSSVVKGSPTLMMAIKTIVVADIIMGTDNVMAVAGASHGNLYLVAIGLACSIPIIVWGSKIILSLMERYPIIIYFGAGILCYTAGKMITAEETIVQMLPNSDWQSLIPYLLICFMLSAAFLKKKVKNIRKTSTW